MSKKKNNAQTGVPAAIEPEHDDALPAVSDTGSLAELPEASAALPSDKTRVVYDATDDSGEQSMSGGYASVKGKPVAENKLVWITMIVMSVLCVIISVCTALITAHFMRSGQKPPVITPGDIQQNITAVVSSRKSCIAEVSCGSLRGSGIVTKRDGENVYIITNTHVILNYVENNRQVSVRFYGEDGFYPVTVIGYDPHYDIAVLCAAHQTAFAVYNLDGDTEVFSPDTEYAEGDYVVSIGNAMGFGVAAYDGIISRKAEYLECDELLSGNKKIVPVMRTTAVINAGMSGGGLFDMRGRLIGLGTYRMSNSVGVDQDGGASTDVEDTGFVTPVSIVYSVYKRIMSSANGQAIGLPPITLMKDLPVDHEKYDVFKNYAGIKFNWLKLPFGFDCAYIGGKLTVSALDLVAPSNKVNVGDVITAIGDTEIGDDVCKAIGALLRYNRGGAGDRLKLTVKRGNGTFSFYVDDYRLAI